MSVDIGQDAKVRFSGAATGQMRDEITETGGREVFFAGKLNPAGIVESVRVCSRGHEGAVPALFDTLESRDVVIHNHPNGNISPSDPDLELASVYSHNGHGVYIVDNMVERVYVVVEPFLEKDKYRLDEKELLKAFEPNGPMARIIPHFELRPQQVEMMEKVAMAFNDEKVVVVEAPTGIGKTMAYLLPAVLWALNNRERVVVTTRTINLQEQIIFKDIPLLQKCVKQKFSAVLVKGRGNYLCLHRLSRAFSEATLFDDDDTANGLKQISEWADKTEDGTRSDLPFVPVRELWERVCSEGDTCAGTRCMAYKKCFFMRARREMGKADIIVSNHHMFFSDVAIKKELGNFSSLAVLPAYSRVIFDEAHNIEDSATEYFGVRTSRIGAMVLLGRFIHKEGIHERGLIPFIKLQLMKQVKGLSLKEVEGTLDLIDESILPAIETTREALIVAFSALRNLASEKCGKIGRDIKWRLTEEVLEDKELRELHNVCMLPAVAEISSCAKHCSALTNKLKSLAIRFVDEPESPFQLEIPQLQAYCGRLQALGSALAESTSRELIANTVRWIEIDGNKENIVRTVRCPLHVGKPLSEWVYSNLKTVVMTSATLTVGMSFDYLESRIGLDHVDKEQIESVVLDSPFDFNKQAALYVTTDIVEPNHKLFLEESTTCILNVLEKSGGHAFVLFTSFYALDYSFKNLQAKLRKMGITSMKQGQMSRNRLLERFRSDASSVLFATDSFWEGVDVAGDALQCVILPKLPFRVPTEPILQARSEAIESEGGNAFMAYTVPQAVIKFRQGFGRLIRRKTDWGAIVVLDRRITTKFYGKLFLESLPGVKTIVKPREEIFNSIETFFKLKRQNEK